MPPFWGGVIVGIFFGFMLGCLVVSLAVIARQSDERAERILRRQKFENLQ